MNDKQALLYVAEKIGIQCQYYLDTNETRYLEAMVAYIKVLIELSPLKFLLSNKLLIWLCVHSYSKAEKKVVKSVWKRVL